MRVGRHPRRQRHVPIADWARFAFLVAAGWTAVTLPAVAQQTWIGPGGSTTSPTSGTWDTSTSANWSGGLPTSGTGTGNRQVFGGNTSYTVTTDSLGTFSTNRFTFTNTNASGLTITPGAGTSIFSFGGTTPQILQNGSGPVTIGNDIIMPAMTITGSGSGALTLSGALTVSGTLTFGGSYAKNLTSATALNLTSRTIQQVGSGGVTISSPVTLSTTTLTGNGAGGITLSGPVTVGGTVTFAGATNKFITNPTTIDLSARTLQLTGAGDVTITSPILISTSVSTFSGNGTGLLKVTDITLGNNLTFSGTSPAEVSGTVTLTGNRTIGVSGGTVTVSGSIVNDGTSRALTFSASAAAGGTMVLTGNNTPGGVTTVGGTLRTNDQVSLILQDGGQISRTSRLDINVGSSVLLDNSGTNLTDRIRNTAAADTTVLRMQGGSFEFRGMSGAASSETLGTLSISSGSSAVILTPGAGAGSSATLQFGSLARAAGATVDFQGTLGDGTNAIKGTGATWTSLAGTVIPWATVNGTDFATYDTTLGVKAYTAYFTGDLNSAAATDNAKPAVSQVLGGGVTLNSLNLASGIDVDLGGNSLVLTSGGLLKSGAADSTIGNGGALTAGSGSGTTELITHVAAGSTLNINVPITDNGAGTVRVTKSGEGTLGLGSPTPGTYTGATVINSGLVQLNAAEQIGDTSAVIILSGATLDLNGFNETIGSLSNSGNVMLTDGAMLTTGGNNSNTTWTGLMSGSGGITKEGTGTFTIASIEQTYTGPTIINNGILSTGNFLPAATDLTVNSPGIFTFTNSETIGSLSGDGVVRLTGTSARNLTIGNDNSTEFSGQIIQTGTGALSLIKVGTSDLKLSGALSDYAGTTTINAGSITVGADAPSGAAGALGNATSAVLVGNTTGAAADAALFIGGAFEVGRDVTVRAGNAGLATLGGTTAHNSVFSGIVTLNKDAQFTAAAGGQVDFTNTVSGAGGVTKVGDGTVVFAAGGTFDYSGATLVSSGRLQVDGVLAGTSAIDVLPGATLAGSGQVGSATFGLSLTIDDGATIAPGSSIGTMSFFGDQTWGPGGMYELEINNTSGTPGVNWDLLVIEATSSPLQNGDLTITATADNPFVIKLVSVLGDGSTPGDLPPLDGGAFSGPLVFVTVDGTIIGFDPSKFVLDVSRAGPWPLIYQFGLVGDNMLALYLRAPEPGSLLIWSLVGGAGGAWGWRRRRRGLKRG